MPYKNSGARFCQGTEIESNRNNTNCIWKEITFLAFCIPEKSAIFSKDEKVVADEYNNFYVLVAQTTVDIIKTSLQKMHSLTK